MFIVYEITATAHFAFFNEQKVRHRELISDKYIITDKFLKDWEQRVIQATKDNMREVLKLTDFKIEEITVLESLDELLRK